MTLIGRQLFLSWWNARLPLFILVEINSSPRKKTFLENDTDPTARSHEQEQWVYFCSLLLTFSAQIAAIPRTRTQESGGRDNWRRGEPVHVLVPYTPTIHPKFSVSFKASTTHANRAPQHRGRKRTNHSKFPELEGNPQVPQAPIPSRAPPLVPSLGGLFLGLLHLYLQLL